MLKLPLWILTIVLGGLLVAGCGDGKKEGGENKGGTGDAGGGGGDAGGAVKTADMANGATIKGVIKFDGTAPENKPIGLDADAVCSAAHPAGLKGEMYLVKDGKVANVIVWVKDCPGKYAAVAPNPTIDQHGCQYIPHVLGVVAGQEFTIKNSDGTTHNIHGMAKKNPEFNFAQTKAGDTKEQKLSSPEIIKVKCDIHGWMGAYVGVFNNPFFAVTGEDGSFEIKGLPAGKYKLQAWHEKFGTQEIDVEVKEKDAKVVEFPAFKSE